jgi:hypothetical protein
VVVKTGDRPKAKFKAGDRVRITARCEPFPGAYAPGDETTVRRVFWDSGHLVSGHHEGWVCEVDMLMSPDRPDLGYRTFWEYLLAKAK